MTRRTQLIVAIAIVGASLAVVISGSHPVLGMVVIGLTVLAGVLTF